MYCKSAICKSGQFEFDSVINWSLFQYNVLNLTRFNKIAIQGTHQMAADKEAITLSRVIAHRPRIASTTKALISKQILLSI